VRLKITDGRDPEDPAYEAMLAVQVLAME